MSAPETPGRTGPYEVGVALVAIKPLPVGSDGADSSIPGFEPAWGRRDSATPGSLIIATGESAAAEATGAIAKQIGQMAGQIAETVGLEAVSAAASGEFTLDSVEVSFGATLSAGIQTIFTAQGESSAQVTITLTRRSG